MPPTVSGDGSLIAPVSCASPVPIVLIINIPAICQIPMAVFSLAKTNCSFQSSCASTRSKPHPDKTAYF
jgi:hypothetical protein